MFQQSIFINMYPIDYSKYIYMTVFIYLLL